MSKGVFCRDFQQDLTPSGHIWQTAHHSYRHGVPTCPFDPLIRNEVPALPGEEDEKDGLS
jgi:hypothetical protein